MKFNQAQRDEAYERFAATIEPQLQRELANTLVPFIIKELVWSGQFFNLLATDLQIARMQGVADSAVAKWRFDKNASHEWFNNIAVTLCKNTAEVAVATGEPVSVQPNMAWSLLHAGAAPVNLFNPSQKELESMMTEELNNARCVNKLFKRATGKNIPDQTFTIHPNELLEFTRLVITKCSDIRGLSLEDMLKYFEVQEGV